MKEGELSGSPLVDMRVTVYDGSHHPVDSSEMAFKIAASMGLKKRYPRPVRSFSNRSWRCGSPCLKKMLAT